MFNSFIIRSFFYSFSFTKKYNLLSEVVLGIIESDFWNLLYSSQYLILADLARSVVRLFSTKPVRKFQSVLKLFTTLSPPTTTLKQHFKCAPRQSCRHSFSPFSLLHLRSKKRALWYSTVSQALILMTITRLLFQIIVYSS